MQGSVIIRNWPPAYQAIDADRSLKVDGDVKGIRISQQTAE